MRVAGIVCFPCPILIERVRSWDGPILRDREPLRPGMALAGAPWTLVPNFCGALNAVAGRVALVESESGFPHSRAFLRHTPPARGEEGNHSEEGEGNHSEEGRRDPFGDPPSSGEGRPAARGPGCRFCQEILARKNFRPPPLFDYPAGEW